MLNIKEISYYFNYTTLTSYTEENNQLMQVFSIYFYIIL